MTIFPGGFKQFNSTFTKTRIQTDQAQSISKDCQSNHGKPEIKLSLKYFKILPSQPRSLENIGGYFEGYPKITKDKSSDANLTSTRRSRFKLKHGPCVHRSMETSNADLSKPAFNASLSNSMSHFKRGSEQLGTPRHTWV